MTRQCFIAILVTWLVVSFVPALSAASLMRMGKGGGGPKGG
jgi:hypothetical protein